MSDRELVVFVGDNDWAHVCHGWARALDTHSTRFRARCVITNPHRFGYRQDITLATDADARRKEIEQIFQEAAVLVHSGDGDYGAWSRLERFGLRKDGRVLATFHAGSRYRAERPRYDAIDREMGFSLRLITPDCFSVALADPRARPALPVAPLGGEPGHHDPIVICHSPSNRAMKGTALIERAVAALPQVRRGIVEWRLIEGVSHDECLRRRIGTTIFIDQVEPGIGGFGVATLEAMGSGAVCLASVNHLGREIDGFWPRPPVIHVESAETLADSLSVLLADPDALYGRRVASYEWARDVAAAAPCAERLARWLGEAVDGARRIARKAHDPPKPLFDVVATPTVSVGIIARVADDAELASLRAAIRSVQPLADECVVVLDDRSAAGADPALAELGARVHRRSWTHDFAAARNAAQALCRAEWILVIDSDEVLAEAGDFRRAIEAARSNDCDAVTVSVRAIEGDGPTLDLAQPRLYRKSRCGWRYRVHNELVGIRTVATSSARIDASYTGAVEGKLARSLPLLLEMAELEPGEPRWAHLLSRAFNAQLDFERMEAWAERCLEAAPQDPRFAQTWVDLALARLASGATAERSAVATILNALRHQPGHPDLWHTLAVIGLVNWSHLAPTAGSWPSDRTARYAPNLPAAARALGLPLAFSMHGSVRNAGDGG